MSNSVYDAITEQIISRLEKGTVPWQRPWRRGTAGAPRNLSTMKRYRGVNVFVLAMQPFDSPYWLTYRQAGQLEGHVKKGEKSTPVVFWKWLENRTTTEEGKDKVERVPMLRYYRVFNAEQCEGIWYPQPAVSSSDIKPIEEAERVVAGYNEKPRVEHRGNQAMYRPLEDAIYMPKREVFESGEEYYSTLFHEMTHSTGHEKRLARKTLTDLRPFGSTNYSKEELVAEMGAAMLCGEAGIKNRTIDNSASYISGWLSRLKNDRKLVVLAAAQAQKAVDHILGRCFDKETSDDVPQEAQASVVAKS